MIGSPPNNLRLLLATGNKGKLRELNARLASAQLQVLGLDDLDPTPDPIPEVGETFIDNAILKAVGYGAIAQMPALADDSGLAVDALDGAPGVYSARFSGEGATDAHNNSLLLEQLAEIPPEQRSARFCCAVALFLPLETPDLDVLLSIAQASGLETRSASSDGASAGGHIILAEGLAEGSILFSYQGDGGFGYDPLFLSADLQMSFAEASAEEKLKVSHRGRALDALEPIWAHLRTSL